MKDSLKLIVFVLIMGAMSALVLIGVDVLTKERIAANRLFEFQDTVLKANDDTPSGDINDYFESIMEIEEKDDLIIYTHKDTKNVSFTFEGKGLWDDIKGIMTLKEDFQTIVDVTITEQGETPGLGALVGERDFLDTLTGKVFNPTITIKKDAEGSSEVDSISGATGTSSQFQVILNNNYKKYYEAFIGELVLVNEDEIFEAILNAHGIDFSSDDHLNSLMKLHFEEFNENDLRLFVNKTTARITIFDLKELDFALEGVVSEEVTLLITLEQDFKSLHNIRLVYSDNDGHWGKRDFLNDLNDGKFDSKMAKATFPNVTFVHGTSQNDNEIDGVSGVTKTLNTLNQSINELYDEFFEVYEDFDFNIEADTTVEKEILNIFEIDDNEDGVIEAFNSNFDTKLEGGKQLFVNKDTKDNIIVFDREYSLGKDLDQKETLTTILVLEEDFLTVKKLVVLHDENGSHFAKTKFFTEEVLDRAIGKDISKLKFVNEVEEDNDVDGKTGTTQTRDEFNDYLNEVYNEYAIIYLALREEDILLLNILTNNKIRVDEDKIRQDDEYLTNLINQHFNKKEFGSYVVYENKHNEHVTFYFESTYSLGLNLPVKEDLTTIITIQDNLKTIVKMTVLHDENRSHWGKVRLFTSDVLNQATGKNILELEFVSPNKDDLGFNDVDLVADATTTRREFNYAIKDYYNKFIIDYKEIAEEDIIKANILLNAKVLPNDDIDALFDEYFETIDKEGKKLYINKNTNENVFVFEDEYPLGRGTPRKEALTTIVVLDEDFKTVNKLIVLHDNDGADWGKTRFFIPEILNKAIGKDISELVFVDEDDIKEDNDIDGTTQATETRDKFNEYLNDAYNSFKTAFKEED